MSSTEKDPGKSTLLAPDGKALTDIITPRCGNCAFWHFDMVNGSGRGFCYGEPPKIMMVAPPTPGGGPGKVQYHIEMFRPLIEKTSPPCALHKPRMDS